jgi:DNA polymerase-3 subunit alpha
MELQRLGTANTESLAELPDEKEVSLCGIITGVKNTLTKKGDRMAYLTMEDLHGTVEVIVFPELYKSANHLFAADAPLFITGSIDKGEKGVKLKATKITPISDAKNGQRSKINLVIKHPALTQNELKQIKEILLRHRGDCSVYIKLTIPNHCESVIAVDNSIRVNPTESLRSEIEGFLGKNTVSFN